MFLFSLILYRYKIGRSLKISVLEELTTVAEATAPLFGMLNGGMFAKTKHGDLVYLQIEN